MPSKRDSKAISISIRITPELLEQIEKKAEEYGLVNGHSKGKSALLSLFTFMGYMVFTRAEAQIKDVGAYSPKEVVARLSRNMNVGSTQWCWSIRDFMIPAIQQMSVEELLIFGLQNIKTEQEVKQNE